MRMLRLGTVWCAGLAVLMVPSPAGWAMTALACIGGVLWATAPRMATTEREARREDPPL